MQGLHGASSARVRRAQVDWHMPSITGQPPPPTRRQIMHGKVVSVEHLVLFSLQLLGQLQLRRPGGGRVNGGSRLVPNQAIRGASKGSHQLQSGRKAGRAASRQCASSNPHPVSARAHDGTSSHQAGRCRRLTWHTTERPPPCGCRRRLCRRLHALHAGSLAWLCRAAARGLRAAAECGRLQRREESADADAAGSSAAWRCFTPASAAGRRTLAASKDSLKALV